MDRALCLHVSNQWNISILRVAVFADYKLLLGLILLQWLQLGALRPGKCCFEGLQASGLT